LLRWRGYPSSWERQPHDVYSWTCGGARNHLQKFKSCG
jgi:hypothetical protein